MIKAIAFDLIGTLLKEKDVELSPVEVVLERQFGNINNDEDYFAWANTIGVTDEETKKLVREIIFRLYELREPDLFTKLPPLKLATATNHLAAMDEWIKTQDFSKYFYTLVNSANAGSQKPEPKFFEILAEKLEEQPENILFVDDSGVNTAAAKAAGFEVLTFNRKTMKLSEEILKKL